MEDWWCKRLLQLQHHRQAMDVLASLVVGLDCENPERQPLTTVAPEVSMPSSTNWVACAVVALCGLSCRDNTGPSRTYELEIFGVVREQSGAVVGGVPVTFRAIAIHAGDGTSLGKCSGSPIGPFQTTSGGDGRYSIKLDGGGPASFLCLFADAAGTVGGRPMMAAVEVDSVYLGPGYEFSREIPLSLRP
jgi:hypothetical protein